MNMYRIVLAGALVLGLSAVGAEAGGVKEPVLSAAQVTQATSGADGLIVPLILLLVLVATLSNSSVVRPG